MPENPNRRKIGCSAAVSESERVAVGKRSGDDLLVWHEKKCLRQVVEVVHEEGFVGETWPKIERVPVKWSLGRLLNLTPEEIESGITPDEWRIYVSVVAVPRV